MRKSNGSSFICELPLQTNAQDERVMLARMEAGRRIYNAVLGEALKVLDCMRQSLAWQHACTLPKASKERTQAFSEIVSRFDFKDSRFQRFGIACKNAGSFSDRLGSDETQKIASNAFNAVQKYSVKQRGRPRFKGRNRPLHSLEGKKNSTGIRYKRESGCVHWNTLVIPVRVQRGDQWLEEALAHETKYCRILWRTIKGKRKWFVQLIQKGEAPRKREIAEGNVGLDVGPSTVAVVAKDAVALEPFVPTIQQPWSEVRCLQRAMDRSRRANNPHNYHANGTVKKGVTRWIESRAYCRLKKRLAEAERRLCAERKRSHGELTNKVLSLGSTIKTEKLSYKSFQKMYGRSVKVKAPAMFIQMLARKAESAGGELVELNTWSLKMSQYDHTTHQCEKKPLSQRWHRLGQSNTLVQRDCYSAFLALHTNGLNHNPIQLEQGWTVAKPLLREAGLCVNESANGLHRKPAFAPLHAPERIASQSKCKCGHPSDVVAARPEPEPPALSALAEPPVFRHGEV